MQNMNPTDAWKILIQPQRINYNSSNLGPLYENFEKNDSFRKDFDFINKYS